MSSHAIGTLLAAIGVFCFSVRPILVKLVYAYGVDPTTLLTLRLGLALPAFLLVSAWVWWNHRAPPLIWRDRLWIVVLGLLGHYIASWLDMAGLQHVNAGLGRLILFLYPTIVVILSALFLAKPIRMREIAALAISYVGLSLVLLPGARADGQDVLHGAMLIFTGAACYAVYLVAGSQVIGRAGVMRFSANANIVAFIACAAHFLIENPISALDLPLPVWGYAAISTVIPVFAIAEALRRVGANHVALIGAVGPVSALALGNLGLGETLSPMEILGATLILGGVLIVTVKPARA